VEVLPGGKIVVPGTPFLAGSGVFTDACVSGAIRHGGVSLGEAIHMASIRPQTLLGRHAPAVTPGERGPFVLFDWQPGEELRVRRVVG
jgi:N-acetylglucosamine-6-phosphate deacetylase